MLQVITCAKPPPISAMPRSAAMWPRPSLSCLLRCLRIFPKSCGIRFSVTRPASIARRGRRSIAEMAKADEVELAVQVNGKVKSRITVAADADKAAILEVALNAVSNALEGKNVVKQIVIAGRLVNIVAK